MSDFLKKVSYISSDTEFARTHFDWCINNSQQLYIVQKDVFKYSIAVNEHSKTIPKINSRSIIAYNQNLNLSKAIDLLQFLEENEIISKIPMSRDYHRRLVQDLCSQNMNPGSGCTCGALKTYGPKCLAQKFMHSDYCDLIRRI